MKLTCTRAEVRRLMEDERVGMAGAQIFVAHGPDEGSVAEGIAAPGLAMAPDIAFRLYCTGKPAVAAAAIRLAVKGELDLDEALSETLEGIAWDQAGHVTWRHVLTHTAGLGNLRATDVVTLDRSRRARLVRQVAPIRGWESARIADYSEYAGWHLLGEALEAATGATLREVMQTEILGPLGMDHTWYSMTEVEHAEHWERIGVFFDLSAPRPVPMLTDRSPTLCGEWNPAYGAYGSAEDLGRLLVGVMRSVASDASSALEPSAARCLATESSGSRFDRTTKKTRAFTHGFVCGSGLQGFGSRLSRAAFGMAGFFGTSACVCDPGPGIVVAMVLNGVLPAREAAERRRSLLVDAVYDDLLGGQ